MANRSPGKQGQQHGFNRREAGERIGYGAERVGASGRGGYDSGRGGAGGRGCYGAGRGGAGHSRTQQRDPTAQMASMAISPSGEAVAVCNIFTITMEPGAKAYQYDVNVSRVELLSQRERSLAKGADAGQRNLHKKICAAVISCLKKTPDFGLASGAEIVYDGRAMLYSSKPLELKEKTFHIPIEELKDPLVQHYVSPKDHSHFVVKIKPTEMKEEGAVSQNAVELDNVQQYADGSSLRSENRLMRTFLEMATSQYAINSEQYTSVASGNLFKTKPEQLGRDDIGLGLCFRAGAEKGVRVIKNNGDPKPAVCFDYKFSLFYKPQLLKDTLEEMFQKVQESRMRDNRWSVALEMLKGVRVELTYKPHRSIVIGSWSSKPASELIVNGVGGEPVSLATFFSQKYGVKMEKLDWPCVVSRDKPAGSCTEVFPIEFCRVMGDQRVDQEMKMSVMTNRHRKLNIIPPADRLRKINEHAKALGLFASDNPIHKAFGIKICSEQKVAIRRRTLPQIQFASGRPGSKSVPIKPDVERTTWQMNSRDHYVKPAQLKKWAVYCHAAHSKVVDDFLMKFKTTGENKGMVIGNPKKLTVEENTIEKVFDYCVRNRAHFLLFIDDKDTKSHGELKLREAKNKLLTQQLTFEKVQDVVKRNQWKTLENMLHKTNCKLGGLNYHPKVENIAVSYALENGLSLVIGVDVSHPSTGATLSVTDRFMLRKKGIDFDGIDSLDPSVVGICANIAADPHIFAGDYFYQTARKERIDAVQLKDYVKWILEKWIAERGKMPKNVIVLRDGLSEGQFQMATDDELPAVRKACEEMDSSAKPKFMLVVGTKRHAKRFFELSNVGVDNLKPATVISTLVTRPDCEEFFMQSHRALQGTAKPVQYATLVNEIGINNNQYEAFLLALCFDHQISNCATALPEPIYQADELAKRGKDNFEAMRRLFPDEIPRDSQTRKVDAEGLTALISYRQSALGTLRFNA